MKLVHPKHQIIEIIDRIYKRGMTTTSGGNISIRDDNGDIWVTPSAVDKGSLTPDDIVCVKANGEFVGKHKPSSEFPFHKAIYDKRPDLKSVVHAHPQALVAFSIVRKIPETRVITQARRVCGPIGYATYETPGSDELGDVIAVEFEKGYNAIIMENHGTVVAGTSMADAYARMETLEFCARSIIYGSRIGEPNYLTDEQLDAFDKQVQEPLPEMEKVEYSSEELDKRHEICNIVKRACNQGLMISSYGTASVRWENDDFIITPTGANRWDLNPEDLVQVKEGKREPGKLPSRATWIHQEIYKRFPNVNSIIMTQPPYLMAYAVTNQKIDVRTIPESWIFLQDIPLNKFGYHFKTEQNPEILSQITNAMMIQNDSVMITGDSLLQTFDYLEVAEFSAASLVMSSALGNMVPINEEQIQDLRDKFLS